MTYNVLIETLNPTHSLTHSLRYEKIHQSTYPDIPASGVLRNSWEPGFLMLLICFAIF